MSILLTIAIPSNNRAELLDQAIASVLAENQDSEKLQIVVSDNSAGDSTAQLIKTKYAQADAVTYYRSLDAPSLDQNVHKVVTVSSGEYVWLFGDDDLIAPGFLAKLLDYLERNRPDIVVLNSSSFVGNTVIEKIRCPIEGDRIYSESDDDEFLAHLGGYLTYIGAIVVRKSVWLANFKAEKLGTFFAHVNVMFSAKKGRSAHFIQEPAIQMRVHSQTWTSKHFQIWNVGFPEIIWGLEGYSDDAKRAVIVRYPLRSIKRLLASRAYNRFDIKVCLEVLLTSNTAGWFAKSLGLMISVLPQEVFRGMYSLFIRMVRTRHRNNFSPELALSQLKRK